MVATRRGIPRTVNGTITTAGLRWATASTLHETVVAMNPDNFVVRPHRRWVETSVEPDAWKHMTPQALREIDEPGRVAVRARGQ